VKLREERVVTETELVEHLSDLRDGLEELRGYL
jgi:hypothetical protein